MDAYERWAMNKALEQDAAQEAYEEQVAELQKDHDVFIKFLAWAKNEDWMVALLEGINGDAFPIGKPFLEAKEMWREYCEDYLNDR